MHLTRFLRQPPNISLNDSFRQSSTATTGRLRKLAADAATHDGYPAPNFRSRLKATSDSRSKFVDNSMAKHSRREAIDHEMNDGEPLLSIEVLAPTVCPCCFLTPYEEKFAATGRPSGRGKTHAPSATHRGNERGV